MAKTAGLSRQDKKYIEIVRFPESDMSCAGLFYVLAKEFYSLFKTTFGEGFQFVLGHKIPIMNTSSCLVNYHFSIELLLKALICLKNGTLRKNLRIHKLIPLLEEAQKLYPCLSKIGDNPDHQLLLQELGDSFDAIRYGEGTICLSHNKKSEGPPNQELCKLLDGMFIALLEIFEEVNSPNSISSNQRF